MDIKEKKINIKKMTDKNSKTMISMNREVDTRKMITRIDNMMIVEVGIKTEITLIEETTSMEIKEIMTTKETLTKIEKTTTRSTGTMTEIVETIDRTIGMTTKDEIISMVIEITDIRIMMMIAIETTEMTIDKIETITKTTSIAITDMKIALIITGLMTTRNPDLTTINHQEMTINLNSRRSKNKNHKYKKVH